MNRVQVGVVVASCCFGMALTAQAQSRKAGLWEVTSTMTWQQSPFPAGMSAPPNSPFGGGAHTNTVCITQEQIDKFGAPPPQTRGDCRVTNVAKQATGMTAEITCFRGTTVMTSEAEAIELSHAEVLSGKGTFSASWTDEEHSTSKAHFTGTMQAGPSPKPVEWTVDSTSVFKSADCGSVKPIATPDK